MKLKFCPRSFTPSFIAANVRDGKSLESALGVYGGHPDDALILAELLKELKEHIKSGPKGKCEALAHLDCAIKTLYPHSRFSNVRKKLFHLAVAGELSPQQYKRLRELGVKI